MNDSVWSGEMVDLMGHHIRICWIYRFICFMAVEVVKKGKHVYKQEKKLFKFLYSYNISYS